MTEEQASNKDAVDNFNNQIGFDYDTSVIGALNKDSLYSDPENKEFIWPENYVRINTARWADMITGPNGADPQIFVESFDGQYNRFNQIPFRSTAEEYDAVGYPISILIKSFLESPFNDIEMITRETNRFRNKLDEEERRYKAFCETFNGEEQRLYEEWKANRNNSEDEFGKMDTVTEEQVSKTVWQILSEATTEDLFKFKLDIFEQEIVQNSENRDLRSKIRKAKSICEVCGAYQELIDSENTTKESE